MRRRQTQHTRHKTMVAKARRRSEDEQHAHRRAIEARKVDRQRKREAFQESILAMQEARRQSARRQSGQRANR
ncbi:unnamed protein product [Vitrella brassicaformis CCMP3155]|uniref:Uncharacterized protein n=1 Tax=Vitrella brassicaformis (strain CCMP3155) TaxID=1169540 RepID=A0A0G4EP51_VITBC|nr:unnamed protein product [Vitrella brassicaformis CCMP3155]|eukprot:CEL99204.1 unnamed protein product [Vitrella brassicaformis CCMP3155]